MLCTRWKIRKLILRSFRTLVSCVVIIGFFIILERERERENRGERDRERGERRRRSRSRDRERHRRHRSRSREGRKRSRSKSPKTKSRRRKPSLYWDVPPPGFEHIAPLQYKAMQGKRIIFFSLSCIVGYDN